LKRANAGLANTKSRANLEQVNSEISLNVSGSYDGMKGPRFARGFEIYSTTVK
jgi:hypothetical protein